MENLMPSEVARLVLGYLKASGCNTSWETFLKESPDLKEYAECVRRGREYPTNIGGRNLLQFLDAGHQVLQCQVGEVGGSSVELVSSLERVVDQLKSVLSQIHPAQTDEQRRSGDPTHASSRGLSPANCGGRVRPSDDEEARTMQATSHSSTGTSVSRGRAFHPHGDTTAYYLQAVVPPLQFLPNSLNGFKDRSQKMTKGEVTDPCFDPPEKDCTLPLLQNVAPDLFPYGGTRDFNCRLSYGERLYAFANPLSRGTLSMVEDERPVRDTGMDLRRRPVERDALRESLAHSAWREEGSQRRPDENGCPEAIFHKRKARAFNEESRGFEVESGTTVSEEIDVEGASRDPSPVGADPTEATPKLDPPTSLSSELAHTTMTKSRELHEGRSPAVSHDDSGVAATPALSVDDVDAETPAGTEAPPLPTRVPDLSSPRCLLANERSLLPSFTTPVKEARFSPGRYRSPRRKSLIPRRRLLSGNSPSAKPGEDAGNSHSSEDHRELDPVLEELLNNFPFLEKLADNINRVVGTEPTVEVRTPGPVSEERLSPSKRITPGQDLNLPESVIKDILSRTENDPVFEEVLSQMCDKIETVTEIDVMLVTPKSKRTPSSSRRRPTPGAGIPFVTPVRFSAPDLDPASCRRDRPSEATPPNLLSHFVDCCPNSMVKASSATASSGPSNLSATSVNSPTNSSSVTVSTGVTNICFRSDSPLGALPRRHLFPGSPKQLETLSNLPLDASSRQESCFSRLSSVPSRHEARPPSDFQLGHERPSNPLSDQPSQYISFSNPPPNAAFRRAVFPNPPSKSSDKSLPLEAQATDSSSPNPSLSSNRDLFSNLSSRAVNLPADRSLDLAKESLPSHSRTAVNSCQRGVKSDGGTRRWQPSVPLSLPSSRILLSPTSSTRTPTCTSPLQKSPQPVAGPSTSSPSASVTVAASPRESPIKVISRTKEGTDTVACISIPDPSPERDRSFCNTLADIVDLVLTPNSKATLVTTTDDKASPVTKQQEPTHLLFYAPNSGSPVLMGPGAILNRSPGKSPVKVVGSSDENSYNGPNMVQPASNPPSSKRFPVLQPKGPVPPRPVFRIAKQKPLRKPGANSVQARRMKQAKQTNPIFNRDACISKALKAAQSDLDRRPDENPARDPDRSSSTRCEARSPQLKTLMQAASSRRASDKHHVRALDFGSDAEVTAATVDFNLSKTIESIGTSLTGVMQRVLRSSGNPRKRKVPSMGTGTNPKKNCESLSLEGLDVDKLLNVIHKE